MGAFKMLIDVGLNATGVQVGLQKLTNTISGWAGHAAGEMKGKLAAAFGVAAIEEAARRSIEWADNLDALSDRLGVTTDSLQEMGFSAKINNAEMEDFVGVLEKLNSNRPEALADPTGPLAEGFKKLGVTIDDLKKKRADELLKQISRSFQGGDVQSLIGPAREVLGRGAGKIFPALVDGLDEAAASAKRLGIVVDGTTIKQLATLNDEMDIAAMELRSGFIPALRSAVEGLLRFYYYTRGSNSTVGNISAFAGAISGGASFKEANDIRKQVTGEADNFVDKMLAEIDKKSKDREELLKKFRDGQFTPEKEKPAELGKQGGQLGGPFAIRTANQRVGAFINPIAFSVEKEQVIVLKKIEKNTRQAPFSGEQEIYPE